MSSKNKRIEALSKRFTQTSQPPSSKTSDHNRSRHSVYIDTDLMNELDELYRELKHEAYPTELKKSTFLEAMLRQGLENLDEVRASLLPDVTT